MSELVPTIDPRLQYLSYSSLKQLQACPRRFELDKLTEQVEDLEPTDTNITFAFGHVVGEGVQALFQYQDLNMAIWKMFLRWSIDLAAENEKKGKSFWLAIQAVKKLWAVWSMFDDFELLYYTDANGNEVPAVELSFIIQCPDGFWFRGYIDVVLRNKTTGEIVVIEVKTNGSKNINEAEYKNSSQALGYSVILDSITSGHSSYQVYYLVYSSSAEEWVPLPFTKTMLQRARWVQDILLDIEVIKMYNNVGYFPQRGQSCFSFWRECEYYGTCSLDNKFITKKLTPQIAEKLADMKKTFHIQLSVHDLINSQLERQEHTNG